MYRTPLANGSAGGRIYLSTSAVITLLLLAWHFSIQAAAHDTAIAQVRAWLQGMNASASRIQFRLLRGALTIENIHANVHGKPLHIQSILMKGNPASVTSAHPLLQQITVSGIRYDMQQELKPWLVEPVQIPPSFIHIFRHSKQIQISSAHITNLAPNTHIHIRNLNVSGQSNAREILANGTFKHDITHTSGSWVLQSHIPENTGQQTGRISVKSPILAAHMQWSGAWYTQNLRFNVQAEDIPSQSSLSARFQQQDQQWLGDIQANAWLLKTKQFQSLITGQMQFSGTAKTWSLSSDKLLWENTILQQYDTHIKHMTTYGLSIKQPQKHIHIKRMDFSDAHFALHPQQTFAPPIWQWDIDSINVQGLHLAYGEPENILTLPPMNGTASLSENTLTMDISQLVNGTEFWRLRSQKDNIFHIYASHIPLIQLRSLLPEPIRSQSHDIQGSTWLELHVAPTQQWQTSGRVHIDNLAFASKKQKFAAQTLILHIHKANQTGVISASIKANKWVAQFPLTPRQAWSSESHLDDWLQIPWRLDSVLLTQGKIVIGSNTHTWLHHAQISIHNWRSHRESVIHLSADMGMAPLTSRITLQRHKEAMRWQHITIHIDHANMFFLEEWLRISGLPYASRGHFSLSLTAQRKNQSIHGEVNLKFHNLQLLTDKNTTYLQQILKVQSIDHLLQHQDISTSFAGTGDWSLIAATALLQQVKQQTVTRSKTFKISPTSEQHLGSLRIQQDMRLSLNERTRLRKLAKLIRQQTYKAIHLVPDIGISTLTEDAKQRIIQTQAVIQAFLNKYGIAHQNIYPILPQNQHRSTNDIAAIHITIIKPLPQDKEKLATHTQSH